MFRNSAWLLCAFLLCIGHALSQNAPPKSEENHVKEIPSSAHPEASNPSSDHTSNTDQSKTTSSTTHGTVTSTGNPSPSSTKNASEPTSTSPTTITTPKTTPSSPKTSPSPPKPTSTSSPSPPSPSTTTPIPINPTTKPPSPQKGNWSVKNEKNVTCLLIEGIFSIDYTFNKTEKVHADVPANANAKGSCSGKIELTWKNASDVNILEFIFVKNETTKNYVLASFSGQIFVSKLNKTEHFNTNNNVTHFETPLNQSYSCSSTKQIEVDDHTKVTLEEFHLQAFKTSNSTGFDSSVDCASSNKTTPDIVPIIVGCVLALLVIAVLVAYLISRRRSQTRGYLSM